MQLMFKHAGSVVITSSWTASASFKKDVLTVRYLWGADGVGDSVTSIRQVKFNMSYLDFTNKLELAMRNRFVLIMLDGDD